MWYKGSKYKLFHKAFIDHFERVVRYSYYYCKDWEVAKDIAQDTYITLWQNIERIDMQKSVLPYLLYVAKNKTLNIIKAAIVRKKYDSYLTSRELNMELRILSGGPLSSLYTKEVLAIIEQSINQMSENVRYTFLLRKVNNLKNTEIAQVLNISVKTVEWRMMSALRILKHNLREFL